jgi:hypothetical protein
VVEQPAVARLAAGQLRAHIGHSEDGIGAAVAAALGREIGDLDRVLEAGVA